MRLLKHVKRSYSFRKRRTILSITNWIICFKTKIRIIIWRNIYKRLMKGRKRIILLFRILFKQSTRVLRLLKILCWMTNSSGLRRFLKGLLFLKDKSLLISYTIITKNFYINSPRAWNQAWNIKNRLKLMLLDTSTASFAVRKSSINFLKKKMIWELL